MVPFDADIRTPRIPLDFDISPAERTGFQPFIFLFLTLKFHIFPVSFWPRDGDTPSSKSGNPLESNHTGIVGQAIGQLKILWILDIRNRYKASELHIPSVFVVR